MKTISTTVLIILFTCLLGFAQEEKNGFEKQTLFGDRAKITGWYVDLNSTYSQINGENTFMPGLGGGIIVNSNFKIGLIGKTLTYHDTYLKFEDIFDEPVYLVGGHGGLFFEATAFDNKVVHLGIPLILGVGGAEYYSKQTYPEMDDDGEIDCNRRKVSTSPYWVVEPGVNVEVNVTNFMRLYAGYSYRWAMGLKLENTESNALNGSNFNFGIRFGKF